MSGDKLPSLRVEVGGGKSVYKILVVGEGGVGKTSLIDRLLHEQYQENRSMTIGLELTSIPITVVGLESVFLVWDIGGQKRFSEVANNWFSGSNAVIGVYSTTSKESFDSLFDPLKGKLQKVWNVCHDPSMKVVIIGNKSDDGYNKQVHYKLAEKMAKQWKAPIFETSAKTGENVTAAFSFALAYISRTTPTSSIMEMAKLYESTPTFEELNKDYLINLVEQLDNGTYEQAIPNKVAADVKNLGNFAFEFDAAKVTKEEFIKNLREIPNNDFYQVKNIIDDNVYKSILNARGLPVPGTFSMGGFKEYFAQNRYNGGG